jgi:hypothetical protein
MQAAAEQDQIIWEFNPPSAPHFGGLWEVGVKSVKTHLRRTIGEQILTFQELYTLLTQIEAVLNSRPLWAISSDPNDLTALTPGHFLTLVPLTCLPEPDLLSSNLIVSPVGNSSDGCINRFGIAGTGSTCTRYNNDPNGVAPRPK